MVDAQVDKLRVFVSSAMADTSDIDWHNLRNSVYGAAHITARSTRLQRSTIPSGK